ncbi:Peptidyl-tRNA hydrolase [Frankliniella fusca]|uniref:Peptidyl-tRNA hydrolase n=1 Tax=Frankliniella fusca TaxID=407009 RepID=A0AAE1HRU1_9NEOP|nr:Peptidyl-tRNA hydrolase [Frankliniella fusca]
MASSRTTTGTTALVAVLTALLRLTAGRTVHRVHGVDPDVAEVVDNYQHVVPYFETVFQPCPKLPPADQLDVDQLLGTWHLSLLLLADRAQPAGAGPGLETLLDDSLCAGVELTRANASLLRMDWQLHQLGLPAGLADMRLQLAAAELGQPGLWALATPLGGELLGTVTSAAPRSHLVLTVCGAGARDQDRVEHVLTALLTRRAPSVLGSLELLRLSSLMMPANGFRRLDERLLSWGQC